MTTQIKWHVDSAAEAKMKALGINNIEHKTVKRSQIDTKAGLKTQARLDVPLDDNVVEKYGLRMEAGDSFPMTVHWEDSPGHFIPMGGNHRLAGVDLVGAEELTICSFKSTDSEIVDVLPRILNFDHGIPTPKHEAVRQALHIIKTYGTPVMDVAEVCRVHPRHINAALKEAELDASLGKLGVDPGKLTKTIKLKLNVLADSEPVLKAAASALIKAHLRSGEAADFIDEIKAERAESKRLAVVATKVKDLGLDNTRVYVAKRPTPKKATRFRAALSHLHNYTGPKATLSNLGFTDQEDVDTIVTAIKAEIDGLTNLLDRSRKKRG